MENIFEWGEQYSVGNELIDRQHKKLFELGRNIVGSDIGAAQELIDELCSCAHGHFSSEEEHMQLIGYPKIEEHMVLHKTLLEDLISIIKKGIKNQKDTEEVKNFFLCWLLDHVMMQDMQYFHYEQGKD